MTPSQAMFYGNDDLAVCTFVLEGKALVRFRQLCNPIPDFDADHGKHLEKCLGLIFEAAAEKYCAEK